MNNSTEGVTLLAGFIFDVLGVYEDRRNVFTKLFEKTDHLDPANPAALVPIELYNEICDWIEAKIGPNSVRKAGVSIGERVIAQVKKDDPEAASTPRR